MSSRKACGCHPFALDAVRQAQALLALMRFVPKFYFSYFWFSHRPGGGEANA